MKITFLGATQEVTGSKYLVEHEDIKILVDCGLFQGNISKRNWDPLPLDPKSINAIILTHAHLDHTGYIPLFVKNGFSGTIYCSPATAAMSAIVLTDSASLQEESARRMNEMNERSDHHKAPVLPLYTRQDVQHSLGYFKAMDYDTEFTIEKSLRFKLVASHHIIGASFVIISDGKTTLTFSGDLGNPNQLIMKSPPPLHHTDFLVLESTYGNRLHEQEGDSDPLEELGKIIHQTVKKGGVLIIPAFAIARTQQILYALYQLKQRKAIPSIPIFLDSPMAIRITDLFCEFSNEHTIPKSICKDVFTIAKFERTVEESKQIDHVNPPAIIIAGSGMADGGRVLYHLQHFIAGHKNTVLFVGFQAQGTLGHAILRGDKEIKIHGNVYPVHADIKSINNLSAHADYNEILQWLSNFKQAPKKVFLTHGELESAESLKDKIEKRFGWPVVVPHYLDSFALD